MPNTPFNSTFLWANLLGFQGIWWGLVLLGESALLPAALILTLHLLWVGKLAGRNFASHAATAEFRLLVIAASLGFAIDSFLTLSGWFNFNAFELRHSTSSSFFAPLWLLVLWFAFAATLNHSLRWFHNHYVLAAAAGGVFGPVSYMAAWKLQVVEFPNGVWPTALILACVWCVLFPSLICLARVGYYRTVFDDNQNAQGPGL